uniref:SMP-30/Gluconolactonase/LRE-like region domain-containing protein n=1 Tax=Timema poppense TaxID=170557 RepID=A0A7R9DUZ0_TIMPO|nr:unnamed protein product [Timema poppensis]
MGVLVFIALLAVFWPRWCLSESQVTVTQVTRPLEHSEGPHWDEEKGVLFFVDIHQKLVNRLDPVTGEYTFIQLGNRS